MSNCDTKHSENGKNWLGILAHLARGFNIGLCLKKTGLAIIGVLIANVLVVLLVTIFAPNLTPPEFPPRFTI